MDITAKIKELAQKYEIPPQLLGEGIEPKHLNDDKIGRVMDKLYQLNVSVIFLLISLAAVKKFGVATENSHLDSTSLSVEGEYKTTNLPSR